MWIFLLDDIRFPPKSTCMKRASPTLTTDQLQNNEEQQPQNQYLSDTQNYDNLETTANAIKRNREIIKEISTYTQEEKIDDNINQITEQLQHITQNINNLTELANTGNDTIPTTPNRTPPL